MATADFEFEMTVNGKTEDVLSVLRVLKVYSEGEKGIYFSSIELNKDDETVDFDDIDCDETDDFIATNTTSLNISALGPYGHYSELNDIDIFRDMAEAAPEAYFNGEITGSTTYTVQNLNCELKDKILHIKTYFESNEAGPEAYVEYVLKLLPYNKFVELFNIDIDQFDDDSYSEFISDVGVYQDDCFTYMEYDEFMENLEAHSGCSTLQDDEYKEIMENLRSLNISGYYEFIEDYDAGTSKELEYDPVAKAYIDNTPIFKSNQVYNVTNVMREYLRKKGLPYDDESIAKLSLEDAYAILDETY